jgi:8-oxo-dGTP pyrophosphatase MutT (NUDIX family)
MIIFERMDNGWIDRMCELIQSGEIPGELAHIDMIPYRPLTSELLLEVSDYRESSVAILLYKELNNWQSVVIERPTYNGAHSGQIAFPGGKRDHSDSNLVETALREMHEEIGFFDPTIQYIGQLSKVFIPVSKFLVYPHVFITHKSPTFIPDNYEVHEIIPFEIDSILNEHAIIKTKVNAGNGMKLNDVPAFTIKNKIVWGATCLIMNELKMCLESSR